jgi:hypothetical protein
MERRCWLSLTGTLNTHYFLKIRCLIVNSNCNSPLVWKRRSHNIYEKNDQLQHPSIFNSRPPSFWKDLNNQREFMNWVAVKLNVKEPSDWYSTSLNVSSFGGKYLSSKDIANVGGESLLRKYNNSPFLLLTTIFPELQLLPWKFASTPKNFWSNLDNQRKFMNWAAQQLNIKEPSDWYNVTKKVNYKTFIS